MRKIPKITLTLLLIICMVFTNSISLNATSDTDDGNGDPNAEQTVTSGGNGGTSSNMYRDKFICGGIRVSVIDKVTGSILGHSADYFYKTTQDMNGTTLFKKTLRNMNEKITGERDELKEQLSQKDAEIDRLRNLLANRNNSEK